MAKLTTIITIFCLYCNAANGQYYVKGEVLDEDNKPIQNVKIYTPSNHGIYFTGISGGFGVPSSHITDSFIFSKTGFDSLKIMVNTKEYQKLVLKRIDGGLYKQKLKLISRTKGIEGNVYPTAFYKRESYSNLIENDFIKSNKNYNTSISMRIDKASYSNIRRFINHDTKVLPDAVRIDEMLNYFTFNYQEPEPGKTFHFESQLTDCPWNAQNKLLYLNVSAKKLALDNVPPSNFVFLIDVSGSMDQPNRLPLLKEAFQLLVKNLRKEDTVSIVVYGGWAGVWLTPTSGAEKEKISKSIEELVASGDTPGEAAIRIAYQLARSTFMKNGNNRIILATDGDFNVGQSSEKELENLISKERQSGVFLTCLGVGMGNYKDSKIEVLAKRGNGNFAYIDDIREAEKVLVTEFTQTLYSVASDVIISVKFDTANVLEYRLIGYDNNKSILAENIDELEGGEIGSGSGNTIVFELLTAPGETSDTKKTAIATISVSYRIPEKKDTQSLTFKCPDNYLPMSQVSKSLQFATALVMYGLKLRESKYFPDVEWDTIRNMAASSAVADNYLQTQFIELIDKSKKIYTEKRKRKKKLKLF